MAEGEVQIGIAGKKYPLVADSLLPSGKRAITHTYRETNARDPARLRRVEWELSGPIGNSLESVSGKLGVDYTQNIETRHARRIMSLGKRTAVSLSSTQPPVFGATTNSMFGTAYFGTSYFGGIQAITGSSSSSGDIVRFMTELQGYLLVFHGSLVTQIDLATWTVVDTETLPAIVTSVARWQTWVWIALGSAHRMSVILEASASGLNIQHNFGAADLFVTKLAAGSDRLWYSKRIVSNPSTYGIFYTFDQFATSSGTPITTGDPSMEINGIGPFGPYTYSGSIDGLNSFNDQGKPVPLSKALVGHKSTHNGERWADAGFGWNYCTTDIGQRAIAGSTDNPVGVGERMPQFTGHGGRPTEVFADRGEKFDAYLTTPGHSYVYRCVFSDETASTGQPDMYPMRYLASTEVGAIFASNTPTNPVIITGENGNISYETISRDGRDDTFSARLYSTSGGTWYGTTLDRDNQLIKTLRLARLRALNVEFCSDWQLAMTFDVNPWIAEDSRVFINVGQLMDKPGYYTLRPTAGPDGAPMENISGRTMRPRLVQRAEGPNAETLPPELNGTLEVEYDERPEMIWEVRCLLQAGDRPERRVNEIARLADNNTEGPQRVSIPNDQAKYAMVAGVERKDIDGNGVESIEVILHVWDTE